MEKNDSEENTEKNAGQPENRNKGYKNETISNSLEFLVSKKGVFTISLMSLFILLFFPVLEFYNQKVVDPILSKIPSAWYIDIWILLLVASSISATVYLFLKEKRVTNSFFAVSFLLFIVFTYCRFFYGYHFQNFKWFESWYYIDSLFVVFGIVFFLKISNWVIGFKEPEYHDSPFVLDCPLDFDDNKEYKREVFAKKIAEKIQSRLENPNSGSLAIGINGVWGSGKTTFLNYIKGCINEKNRVVIDFNPWRSTSPARIIEDFFNLLVKELEPYDASLSNSLLGYAKSLTKIEDNIITRTTGALSDFVFGTEDKNEKYKSINQSIGKIKKQIIIFIDDLDRLDKKEVIEVLRIIRNTADFRNVVYVVSYDKEYVLTAIQSFNEYNYRSFLEKIFQFEFFLPFFESQELTSKLKDILVENLTKDYKELEIHGAVDSSCNSGIIFFREIISTLRDVTRFANALVFEIAVIKGEVLFYDFYLLQLLKFKYPLVYQALYNRKEDFFINSQTTGRLRFKYESDKGNVSGPSTDMMGGIILKEKDESPQGERYLEKYLRENTLSMGIDNDGISLIIELVDTLLTYKVATEWEGNSSVTSLEGQKHKKENPDLHKSFSIQSNFHKYFLLRLVIGDISGGELDIIRTGDISEYKKKVNRWMEEGKSPRLMEILKEIQSFSTTEEFENHILILLEIAQYQMGNDALQNIFWIDFNNLLTVFEYPIIENPSLYNNQNEYQGFLRNTFEHPGEALIVVSTLVARIIHDGIDLGIPTEQLSQINLTHFKIYCNNNDRITSEFRILHQNAIQRKTSTYIDSDNWEPIPAAQELFVEYFLKNLRGCELNGWIKHVNGRTDYFAINEEWVKEFFDGDPIWEPLEEYLKAADNLKKDKDCYEEFMDFFDKFKNAGYKKVEFVFKDLKPDLWSSGTKSNPQ